MDMEELKNQANELINGNINSYPALSREAAGKAILMLIEKVEKLEEQLRLTQIDNNLLMTENARYIERIQQLGEFVRGRGFLIKELTSELSKLKVQADRHREALEFYADYRNWMKSLSDTHYSPEQISMDCGLRAKQALKGE